MNVTSGSCVLYLSHIKPNRNTVHNLKSHFTKFGAVHVKTSYRGDATAAAVRFSSHQMARAAYDSSNLVLNDRLIKKSLNAPHFVSTSESSDHKTKSRNIGPECPVCGRILSTEASLRNHIKKLHEAIQCEICNGIFVSEQRYRNHWNAIHRETENSTAIVKHSPVTPQAQQLGAIASGAKSDDTNSTSTLLSKTVAPQVTKTTAQPSETVIPIATAAEIKCILEDVYSSEDAVAGKKRKIHSKTFLNGSSSHSKENADINELKWIIEGLKKERAAAIDEAKRAKEHVAILKTENSKLKDEAEAAEHVHHRTVHQAAELAEKGKRIAKMKHELDEMKQKLEVMKQEVAKANAAVVHDAELAEKGKRIAKMEHELDEMKQKLEVMKQEVAKANAAVVHCSNEKDSIISSKNNKIIELKINLRGAQNNLAKLNKVRRKKTNNDQDPHMQYLYDELAGKDNYIMGLQQSLANLDNNVRNQMNHEMQMLKNELAHYKFLLGKV